MSLPINVPYSFSIGNIIQCVTYTSMLRKFTPVPYKCFEASMILTFPSVTTISTSYECCHRLIRRPCL